MGGRFASARLTREAVVGGAGAALRPVLRKLSPLLIQSKQKSVAQVCAGMCVWRFKRRLVSAVCSHGRDGGEEKQSKAAADRWSHFDLRVWPQAGRRFPSLSLTYVCIRAISLFGENKRVRVLFSDQKRNRNKECLFRPRRQRSVHCRSPEERHVCSRRSLSQSLFVCGARAALTFAHISCRVNWREHIAALTQELDGNCGSMKVGVEESKGGTLHQLRLSVQHLHSQPQR